MAINIYKHADNNSAGGGDGSSWDLAGANAAYTEAELETFLEGAGVAGDVIFVKDSIFNLDSHVNSSARNGIAVSPIAIIGVKAGTTNVGANIVYSDWAVDAADRPFFDNVIFQFRVGDYYKIRNISFQGSESLNVVLGIAGLVENCKFENDIGVSSAYYCINIGNYGRIINCEVTSINSRGIKCGSYSTIKYNYIHDLPDAVNGIGIVISHYPTIEFNIMDNMTIGVSGGGLIVAKIINNTFYDCNTGISETIGCVWIIINNIFSDCTTAPMSWGTQIDNNFIWNNHIHNCGANVNIDETTCFQDYEVTTGDPLFTNAGVDFLLQDTSPNLAAGMSIDLGVG